MAEFDQDSGAYIAQCLREMTERRASVAPLVQEGRDALPADCPSCGGSGRRGGCNRCGVTR